MGWQSLWPLHSKTMQLRVRLLAPADHCRSSQTWKNLSIYQDNGHDVVPVNLIRGFKNQISSSPIDSSSMYDTMFES